MSTADIPAAVDSPATNKVREARILDKSWEQVQKKTFTKWVNTQLIKRKYSPIENMADEFSDGTKLLQLLEVIGDENFGKYNKQPKMRIQKCENMNKALEFIKARGVSLTNIGAEDLVDKNEKLVLGMIWTLILRFTISEISEEGLTAKEGLLLWCQRKTHGYKDVSVKDFTFSWQDGLALCALIHRHRPDLLDFNQLSKSNKKDNINLAMDVAEKHLQIPKLFDAEDLCDLAKPDERSVMTYVAQYFHKFSSMSQYEVAGRRVGKFAGVMKSTWEMKNDYERRARQLISSIQQITETWQSATFDDSYADAKRQSNEFTDYKNQQKREWISEKRELDTLLSNIQTKLKTYNLAQYFPPQGLGLADLDQQWTNLLSAETQRRKVINEKIAAIKESLRKRYSDLANEMERSLNEISLGLGHLEGDLQQQLEQVTEIKKRFQPLEQKLEEVKQVDNECEQAAIEDSDRQYTIYSVEDLEFDLGLVRLSIQKKSGFLENQIVAQKNMSNLTPAQLEEFESTFRTFDKNNSNTLSKLEFKACLASLGKALEDQEVDKIFAQVSTGSDFITFEQFTKFMVGITEDKTSPEQILESFKGLANGKNYITENDLRIGQLAPEQVEYFKSVLPQSSENADGYDYVTYLTQVFPK